MTQPSRLDAALAARGILDLLPVPVFIVDRERRILYSNPAFRETYRPPEGDGPGQCQACARLAICETDCVALAALDTGGTVARRGVTGLDSRDQPVSLDPTAVPLTGDGGGLAAVLLVHSNLAPVEAPGETRRLLAEERTRASLTQEWYEQLEQEIAARTGELKRAYREIETLSRMKSDFLTHLAHELKTPLTAILGFGEILLDPAQDPAQAREFAREIYGQAHHLHMIVEDILNLSRMEAGLLRYDRKVEDVNEIVEGTALEFREECQAKGVELRLDLGTVAPTFMDHEKIGQVVRNLLRNAVEFTPAGGRITVSTGDEDRECRIAVTDTGLGLEPADLGRVFEKFTQVEDLLHHHHGLGLGLALSRKLIEDGHHGRITAASEGKGKGSTFTIHLPR